MPRKKPHMPGAFVDRLVLHHQAVARHRAALTEAQAAQTPMGKLKRLESFLQHCDTFITRSKTACVVKHEPRRNTIYNAAWAGAIIGGAAGVFFFPPAMIVVGIFGGAAASSTLVMGESVYKTQKDLKKLQHVIADVADLRRQACAARDALVEEHLRFFLDHPATGKLLAGSAGLKDAFRAAAGKAPEKITNGHRLILGLPDIR